MLRDDHNGIRLWGFGMLILKALPSPVRGWRDVQRYLAEGPAHLISAHGRAFASGAALLAAAVAGGPIAAVPAFIAARTDGAGGGGGASSGTCVSPLAVEALLAELRAQPLFQVYFFFRTKEATWNVREQ